LVQQLFQAECADQDRAICEGRSRHKLARVKISLVRAFSVPLCALFSIVCSIHSVYATERHFAFTYEVATTAKGELELENWVTWQFHGGRNGDPSSSEFDFRHEFEYGITDRLQTSLYFADWHINDHFDSTDPWMWKLKETTFERCLSLCRISQ
jgi:hypothetical protein